jgi:hypothetical protein
MRCADIAMCAAKPAGVGYTVFGAPTQSDLAT